MADPKVAYRILMTFAHKGVSYSRGEPIPDDLPAEEIEKFLRTGHIQKVVDDVAQPRPPRREEPQSVDEYLRGSAIAILTNIREHKPSRATLEKILERAVMAKREVLLIEAIRLKLDDWDMSGPARPRTRPPRA